jgi:hypothetical protein
VWRNIYVKRDDSLLSNVKIHKQLLFEKVRVYDILNNRNIENSDRSAFKGDR